ARGRRLPLLHRPPDAMRLAVLLFACALAACTGGNGAAVAAPANGGDRLTFDGTVVYQDLEGGFYGIVTAQGHDLLPTNLPVEYEEDGLAVRVAGRFPDDVATARM